MKLSVLIGGDDRELQAAIKRATSSMRKLGGEFRQGVTDVAKYGTAMAAAGAALTVHMVNRSMQAVDAQADLAQQLRTTVSSLATLERAGDLAGISVEQLSTASTKLNVNISDAARGIGPAVEAFQRLNLSAEQLSRIPLDQRIGLINQRIKEIVPASEQASVAADVFGQKVGTAMMQLDTGTLRRAAEEARVFGTALSEVDAAKVAMANDSIGRISMAVDGFWKQLTVKLAPVLKAIGDHLFEVAKEAGGMGAVAAKAFNKMVDAAGFVMDAIEGIKRVFSVVADALIVGFAFVSRSIADAIGGIVGAMDMIPGVDFTEAHQSIVQFAKDSTGVIEEAKRNIDETLMKPLPSEGLRRFVDDAIAAGEVAAQAAAAAQENLPKAESDDEGISEKRLEQLQKQFMTEQELKRQHQQVLRDLDLAFIEGQIVSEDEFYAMRQAAEQAHQDQLVQIRSRGLTDLEKFTKMSYQGQTKMVMGELANMTAGVSQHSKTMFNINKTAGIANALISAYEGISLTMSKYPFPINVGMAAAHAASAFAQVQAIRSQSFGGGGGAAPSIAGSTPAPPVSPIGNGSGSGSGSPTGPTSIIHLNGDSFGPSQIRALMERINEDRRDGGRIVFAP